MVWFFIRLNLSKPHPSTALAFGMLYTLRLRKNSEMRMADNPLYEDRPNTREQFRTSVVFGNSKSATEYRICTIGTQVIVTLADGSLKRFLLDIKFLNAQSDQNCHREIQARYRVMKERLHTIAAVIALVASGPTLAIAVGYWSGYLSDDWPLYALILMGFFGLPASFYLVTSYWRERNARNVIVIAETPSASLVPPEAKSGNTQLRLVSSA